MNHAAMIEYAATRYGRRNPSPDDILAARWPQYGFDAIHTAGYHRDFELVLKHVVTHGIKRICKVCPTELTHGNTRYCSPACRNKASASNGGKGKSHRPVLEPERAQIVALRKRGMSVADIARSLRRGQTTILNVLHESGAYVGTVGKPREISAAERARMVELYEVEEMSIIEVGESVGRATSTVAKQLHLAGVKLRGSGRLSKRNREQRAA